jgi:hypothetical protein
MVANLAPRKMKFGLSEGMVLAAASDPDGQTPGIFLLSPDAGAQARHARQVAPACLRTAGDRDRKPLKARQRPRPRQVLTAAAQYVEEGRRFLPRCSTPVIRHHLGEPQFSAASGARCGWRARAGGRRPDAVGIDPAPDFPTAR